MWQSKAIKASGFYIRVQNKITTVQIVNVEVNNDMLLPHIQKMWPKARMKIEGKSHVYIGFKLTQVQIKALRDYLEFMFNTEQ